MTLIPKISVVLSRMEGSLSRVVLVNDEYVGVLSEYHGKWTIICDGCGFLRDGEPFYDVREAANELVWHALDITFTDGE